MADKKDNFLSKMIVDIAMLLFSLFKFIPNLIFVIELEARSVGKNLASLLILCLMAGTLFISIWLCVQMMLFIYFVSLHLSWLLSLFIILSINVILLIIIALTAAKIKNNLSFIKTRHLLHNIINR